jgi:hypothetical protein
MATVEEREEAIIASLHKILDVVEDIRDGQKELMDWLAKPPSSELPELLKALLASVHTISAQMNELPAAVARAVKDGEVR